MRGGMCERGGGRKEGEDRKFEKIRKRYDDGKGKKKV